MVTEDGEEEPRFWSQMVTHTRGVLSGSELHLYELLIKQLSAVPKTISGNKNAFEHRRELQVLADQLYYRNVNGNFMVSIAY